MTYKIIDIEGVGEVYAPKLIEAGIKDTDALLEKCAKPAGRKALEEVNAAKNLVNRVPALVEVEKMVAQAKELPPMMEY